MALREKRIVHEPSEDAARLSDCNTLSGAHVTTETLQRHVSATISDMLCHGGKGVSLKTLRELLQRRTGVGLSHRKAEIRHLAELTIRALNDEPLSDWAGCCAGYDCDRGRLLYTKLSDEVGTVGQWCGTWEALVQTNGCILEIGRAGRACIKEKAMMHNSSMIYCGKFITSQFEPLCERCAVLVDGHVGSGGAMTGSRPNSHGLQEKHGAEATEQRSMGVLRVKRAINGNVPKHEVAGVLLSGAFCNFDPGGSCAPDKVLGAPEGKCVESFADKTSTFETHAPEGSFDALDKVEAKIQDKE